MTHPSPKQTKRQKKALAFRTRQKTSKRKNKDLDEDEDALGFPIDENQDLAGLEGLPLETKEIFTGDTPNSQKGKGQDSEQYQTQPVGSKKRKREGDDAQKARKKSKAGPTVSGESDGDGQKHTKVKKMQPQRFILFIGTFLSNWSECHFPTQGGGRELEVFYIKRCYSFPFLPMRYGTLETLFPHRCSHASH